ncbi:MAG: hypothetical protein ACTSRI_00790 [Promethearchaeota archaeon]
MASSNSLKEMYIECYDGIKLHAVLIGSGEPNCNTWNGRSCICGNPRS